ncbi:MAG TPA: hypothetical protein VJV79_18540, partial [Polyangiaceae bacterium]|nr:hypothetical protein [Polyangiaceae bacterium]
MSLLAEPKTKLRAVETSSARRRASGGFASRVYAVLLMSTSLLAVAGACSSKSGNADGPSELGGAFASGGSGVAGGAMSSGGLFAPPGGGPAIDPGDQTCPKKTCAELGWACGYTVDKCNNVIDCAKEGLSCSANQVCIGGVDGPTKCVAGGGQACALCSAIPDCSQAGSVTHLTGRVLTPGRSDANAANQIGVPNAIVYILQTNKAEDLPAITAGIPSGGTSCDRCEDQDFGPVLNGTVT